MPLKDLRNIHTIRNSCANMAGKLPQCFYQLMEKAVHLVRYSKFGLLNIGQLRVTRKHLLLYPEGDSSGLRMKAKKG